MKLNRQLSPKQKSVLQKTPEILLALFFLGVLSTQIHSNKITQNASKELKKAPVIAENHVESLSKQENTSILSEKIENELVEVEEEALSGNQKATYNPVSSAATKQIKSVAKSSSAVAYTNMKMEVANYSGKISWASSFQRNIKSFAIERSIDDEIYTEIGRIAGAGKGEFTQQMLYEFEDTSLLFVQMPSVLYRIKQEGVNGDQDYSEIIEFDLGLPEGLYASIKVSDTEMLNIQYAATTSGPLSYQILDAFGKSVSQGNLQGEYEPKSLSIEIKNWEKGSYYLKLEAEKHSFMEAFTIN